jgi:hypothetical protein
MHKSGNTSLTSRDLRPYGGRIALLNLLHPHPRQRERVGTATLDELTSAISTAITGPPYVADVPAAARQTTAATPTATYSSLAA